MSDEKKSKQSKKLTEEQKKERAEKLVAENLKFEANLKSAISNQYIYPMGDIDEKDVPNKLVDHLTKYILRGIDILQSHKSEYNPYPADKFSLINDKLGSGNKGRMVKKVVKEAVPKKKLPKKKGAEQEDDEPEEEAPAKSESKAESKAPAKSESSGESAEEKKQSKKSIVVTTKGVKTFLWFTLNNYMYELYSLDNFKAKDNSEFVAAIYKQTATKKEFDSSMLWTVTSIVERCSEDVSEIQGYGMTSYLQGLISDIMNNAGMQQLADYVVGSLEKFFKIVGLALARHLWFSPQKVTFSMLASTIMTLELGNMHHLHKCGIVSPDVNDRGITAGLFNKAIQFDLLMNGIPKRPTKKSKSGEEKTKKSKKTKDSDESEEKPKKSKKVKDDDEPEEKVKPKKSKDVDEPEEKPKRTTASKIKKASVEIDYDEDDDEPKAEKKTVRKLISDD